MGSLCKGDAKDNKNVFTQSDAGEKKVVECKISKPSD